MSDYYDALSFQVNLDVSEAIISFYDYIYEIISLNLLINTCSKDFSYSGLAAATLCKNGLGFTAAWIFVVWTNGLNKCNTFI